MAGIRAAAELEANRIRVEHMQDAERQIDRERTRALNLAKARELRETAEAFDQLFASAIAEAGVRLSAVRAAPCYRTILAEVWMKRWSLRGS